MDLFERYLHAVRSFLPKRQQDDVVRELSDDLRSQAEDREAELGRPLNDVEREEILKQFGHPLLLASRYQPQRHLVGPVLFPIYWLVLKISVGIAVIVHAVSAVVFVANGRPPGDAIASVALLPFGPLLMVFAWVTLAFALIDRTVSWFGLVASWNPKALPNPSKDTAGPSMACLIGNVVLATLFVIWLAAVPSHQWLIFGPAVSVLALGPVWHDIHVPLLLLAAGGLVTAWLHLLQPGWRKFHVTAKMAGNVLSFGAFVIILNADPLVVPVDAGSVEVERIAAMVSTGTRIGFGFAAVATVIETVSHAVRLIAARWLPGNWFPRRG